MFQRDGVGGTEGHAWTPYDKTRAATGESGIVWRFGEECSQRADTDELGRRREGGWMEGTVLGKVKERRVLGSTDSPARSRLVSMGGVAVDSATGRAARGRRSAVTEGDEVD
jgi:hypothetical protein